MSSEQHVIAMEGRKVSSELPLHIRMDYSVPRRIGQCNDQVIGNLWKKGPVIEGKGPHVQNGPIKAIFFLLYIYRFQREIVKFFNLIVKLTLLLLSQTQKKLSVWKHKLPIWKIFSHQLAWVLHIITYPSFRIKFGSVSPSLNILIIIIIIILTVVVCLFTSNIYNVLKKLQKQSLFN